MGWIAVQNNVHCIYTVDTCIFLPYMIVLVNALIAAKVASELQIIPLNYLI